MTALTWKIVASVAAAVAAFFALRIFGVFFTTALGCTLGAVVAAVLVWKFVAVWELKNALEVAKSTAQGVVKKIGG